jgi:hypothetical protein
MNTRDGAVPSTNHCTLAVERSSQKSAIRSFGALEPGKLLLLKLEPSDPNVT